MPKSRLVRGYFLTQDVLIKGGGLIGARRLGIAYGRDTALGKGSFCILASGIGMLQGGTESKAGSKAQ